MNKTNFITDFIKSMAESLESEVTFAVTPEGYKGEFRQFISEAKSTMKRKKVKSPVYAFIYDSGKNGTRVHMEFNNNTKFSGPYNGH